MHIHMHEGTYIHIPTGGVASVLQEFHPLYFHMEEYQYEVENICIHDALWCENHCNLRHCLVSATDRLK